MIYLTSTHQTPPAYVHQGDMLHPTAEAIAANDTARLAELDIWPHVTIEGLAPLGYTDWVFADGVITPISTVANAKTRLTLVTSPSGNIHADAEIRSVPA